MVRNTNLKFLKWSRFGRTFTRVSNLIERYLNLVKWQKTCVTLPILDTRIVGVVGPNAAAPANFSPTS